MPIYDYYCSHCNKDFEIIQRITEPVLRVCSDCMNETLEKKISKTAPPIFKASGFYETTYKRKPRK